MVRLETTTGSVVYVNPAHVRSIWAAKDRDQREGVQVQWSDEDYWIVKGTVDEVAAMLTGTPRNFGVPCTAIPCPPKVGP